MSEKDKQGLTSKFVIYIALALLIVVGTTNYWLYRDSTRLLNASMDQAADAKLANLVSLGGYYINHFENELLENLGRETQSQPGVHYIAINNHKGEPLVTKGRIDTNYSRSYKRDLIWNNARVGTLELVLDTYQLQRDLRGALWFSLALGIFSIVLLGGLLYLFFHSLILAEVERAKHEEAMIREDRYFYASIVNTSNNPVIVADLSGIVVLVNRAAINAKNCSIGDVIGERLLELFDIKCLDDNTSAFDLSADKGTVCLEVERLIDTECLSIINNHLGEEIIIEWRFTYLPDHNQNIKYIIGNGVDITGHYLKHKQLKKEVQVARESKVS